MTDLGRLPPVSSDEWLARFVIVDSWIREDNTVRQDAFIPPKDLNLSVTRHLQLSQAQLWTVGEDVAQKRQAKLLGRADLPVVAVEKTAALRAESAPLPENPHHTHITGWPLDKPGRKNLAQQLALAAVFVPTPGEPTRKDASA